MILVGLPLLFAFYHLNIRKKTKIEWLENWEQKLKIEFNSRELLKEHNVIKFIIQKISTGLKMKVSTQLKMWKHISIIT